MAAYSNGSWRKIGDAPYGLGIERYENGNKDALWRFRITRGPGRGSDVLIDSDAKISDLLEIKNFCDCAIKMVKTDGERIPQETAGPAPAPERET